jgi:trigger factor
MSLKISTEPMERRQLALVVEVEQERVDQELRKAARKLAADYRIPGFRRGKAPYHIVTQYVGLPTLFNEFVEPLGQEIYKQALEESGIEPYAAANLDIEGLEPLTYKFVVPMDPEIDMGDYRSLRVEESEPVIEDDEIEKELETYREDLAEWSEVERPSQYGDTLTIDVKSVIIGEEDQEGEETVVLDETDWDVTLDEENPLEPQGFDDALLGMQPGEEKEFTLDWPAESQSIYAGKSAQFKVKLHKLQAHTQPELNDDFAKMVGPDFETLDALKENIRTTLLEAKMKEAENNYLQQVLDKLIEQSSLNYPPVVVEDQIDMMVNEFERQLRQYGIENVEAYLTQVGQNIEDYRESLRPQAEIVAKQNLVISELYRVEGIEVTEEEIEARIQTMLGENTGETENESMRAFAEMMRAGSGRSILESQILQEKALQRLLAIARGEELPDRPEAVTTAPAGEASVESTVAESAPEETPESANSAPEGSVEKAENEEA